MPFLNFARKTGGLRELVTRKCGVFDVVVSVKQGVSAAEHTHPSSHHHCLPPGILGRKYNLILQN
jgi:hypothetical protein